MLHFAERQLTSLGLSKSWAAPWSSLYKLLYSFVT
jgi:hypothetical protein